MWLYLALLLFRWIVEMFSLKDDQTDTRYPRYNTIFQHIFSTHVTAAKLIPCKTFYEARAAVNRHARAATHVQMFDMHTEAPVGRGLPELIWISWCCYASTSVETESNVDGQQIIKQPLYHGLDQGSQPLALKESHGPIKLHSETQLFDQLTEGNTAHEVFLS